MEMNATDYSTLLKNSPKADLHNHLTLGLRMETLMAHFPEAKFKIPKRYIGLPGMMLFLRRHVGKIMNDRDSTLRFMELALEDSIADHVVLLEAGVDIRYVQRLLGHSSISTTEIYTHVSDNNLHDSIVKANPRKQLL